MHRLRGPREISPRGAGGTRCVPARLRPARVARWRHEREDGGGRCGRRFRAARRQPPRVRRTGFWSSAGTSGADSGSRHTAYACATSQASFGSKEPASGFISATSRPTSRSSPRMVSPVRASPQTAPSSSRSASTGFWFVPSDALTSAEAPRSAAEAWDALPARRFEELRSPRDAPQPAPPPGPRAPEPPPGPGRAITRVTHIEAPLLLDEGDAPEVAWGVVRVVGGAERSGGGSRPNDSSRGSSSAATTAAGSCWTRRRRRRRASTRS